MLCKYRVETESGHSGNSVAFCLGQPGLTRFKKHPGLTRILHTVGSHTLIVSASDDVSDM